MGQNYYEFYIFQTESTEVSYGGMRFLLTKEADVNVFEEYLGSESYRALY